MVGVVVSFPNKENATNIKNLLTRSGVNVIGVCTTGAQTLTYLENLEEAVVICGYKLKDMMYWELRELMPADMDMLLVASRDKWDVEKMEHIVGLAMPIKAYDLVNALETMFSEILKRRRQRRKVKKGRSQEQIDTIKNAKLLLMEKNNFSEEEAHRYLQKNSMDSGTNMVETAEMVLRMMDR